MNFEDLEAFLTVVTQGSITSAAEHLYTTQSAISKRLNQLESDVGVTLVVRKKGKRRIKLTPQGEAFLELAKQMESLLRDLKQIQSAASLHEVSIAAIDLVNNFTFKDLYSYILEEKEDLRLDIHTRHSNEIYLMASSHQIDLGISNLLLPGNHVKITPLYKEKMLVITYPEDKKGTIIKSKDLDPALEIYSRWSKEYEIWHDQMWPGKQYRMHVGTSSMIPYHLNKPGRWAICPYSSVSGMIDQFHFDYRYLEEETPDRTFYMIEPVYERDSRKESIKYFKECMMTYLKEIISHSNGLMEWCKK